MIKFIFMFVALLLLFDVYPKQMWTLFGLLILAIVLSIFISMGVGKIKKWVNDSPKT